MNIALPVLLLVFGGLTFWVLNESSLKWYFKTACISVFCIFTIVFFSRNIKFYKFLLFITILLLIIFIFNNLIFQTIISLLEVLGPAFFVDIKNINLPMGIKL